LYLITELELVIPLAVDGANRHDMKLIRETIENIYFLISSEF